VSGKPDWCWWTCESDSFMNIESGNYSCFGTRAVKWVFVSSLTICFPPRSGGSPEKFAVRDILRITGQLSQVGCPFNRLPFALKRQKILMLLNRKMLWNHKNWLCAVRPPYARNWMNSRALRWRCMKRVRSTRGALDLLFLLERNWCFTEQYKVFKNVAISW